MIVVDTNVIGYLFLASERSEQSELVLRKDPDWAAPRLWRSEFRNVLAFYTRKGLLTLRDALAIFEAAEELMRDNEYVKLSPPRS
ncbi:MAG: type II toxin-antitoxin system VapC family toxin [Anaerolineae bacterium]|nr:type II toxin-antitoxin system VapC family toxin [Anaerolineae bacterium]